MKLKKFSRFACFSVLLMGIVAAPPFIAQQARATMVVEVSFEKSVEQAAAVIRGTVTAKEGKFVDVGQEAPVPMTEYTVSVDHVYVGDVTAKTVTLLNPGGVEKDGLKYEIPSGFPDHQIGEDLILMLEPAGPGNYVVVGLHQGKFFVVKSEETGKEYVTRTNSSAVVVNAETKQAVSDFTKQQLFDLDEFEAKIEDASAKANKSFKSASSSDDSKKSEKEETEE